MMSNQKTPARSSTDIQIRRLCFRHNQKCNDVTYNFVAIDLNLNFC